MIASKSIKALASRVPVALLSMPWRGTQVVAVSSTVCLADVVADASPPCSRQGKAARQHINSGRKICRVCVPWKFIATRQGGREWECPCASWWRALVTTWG